MGDYTVDLVFRGILRIAMALPYERRVPFVGWLMSRVIAPLAGWSKRIRTNLAYVCPDLSEAEIKRIVREVPNNAGRTLIEMYSGAEFLDRVTDLPINGPGVAVLRETGDAGRPAVLVTAHFGNYNVPRAAIIAQGYPIGGLYNPMKNPFFNAHYEKSMSAISEPLFPRSRHGLAKMVKFLKDGGMAGMLVDQYMAHGAPLTFFGQTAPTALSAAELALKYDAELIPIYGLRKEDGLSFEIYVDAPIAHTTAEEMTQQLNNSLEKIVRQNMGQWFWIHRRWKPERQLPKE